MWANASDTKGGAQTDQKNAVLAHASAAACSHVNDSPRKNTPISVAAIGNAQ